MKSKSKKSKREPVVKHTVSYLKAIMLLSALGTIFSGYFSYTEVFGGKCSAGGCTTLFGMPICVLGFVMFSMLFIISIVGSKDKKALV